MNHQDLVNRLNIEYAAKLELYMTQLRDLTAEKDAEIRQLTIELEQQRSEYELRINELELTLQKYQ